MHIRYPNKNRGFMKIKKPLLVLLIIIKPINILYSQTQPKNENTNITLENNPLVQLQPSDYLEKHIASKKIPKLKEEVERNLRKLGKIQRTYKNDIQDAQKSYDEAAENYKKGVEAYYSGDLLNAYNLFLKSKSISNQLLEKFSSLYRNKAVEISSEIASKLSNLQEDKLNAPYFLIHETEFRLNTIKSKISSAEEMIRFKKYGDAIELYRNAKIIGIISLYKLEQDKTKQEQLLEKYKADLEDANYKIENVKIDSF
jgi:hypothetical protein